ncbi:MAG: pyridoxal 4-dehydrogenase [Sphingomonas sanxanigenens]|uniref:Pyridoxal 4-dehydrogenase n=1 Tax=Sphingomonas sanxanigenens TaxID=397260 RepID=A0A2W5AFQ2_9SPHN|nr:MAG: pyridoxal 4-dehydrogenase [Sphingomonas sanxanigenens]
MALLPTRSIGDTGLAVTELGFGAAAIGNLYRAVPDDEAAATVAAAIECGFGYFDTAPHYGFGLSERRLGDMLRGRPDLVRSTKVGRLLRPDSALIPGDLRHGFRSPLQFEPVFDYSYDGILRSHADSLQRLGLAQIDILYVHDIGRLTHGEADELHFDALTAGGGLRAMAELRQSGAVRAIGIGVNEIEACGRVLDHMALDVILLAGRYTLLEQEALTSLLPRCEAAGTALVIGGPYNSGILATGVSSGVPTYYNYASPPADIIARVAQIEKVCADHDVPLPAAALQFVLAHPAVASVIPGLGSADQVRQAVALYRAPIPSDFWIALRRQGLIPDDAPTPGAPDR